MLMETPRGHGKPGLPSLGRHYYPGFRAPCAIGPHGTHSPCRRHHSADGSARGLGSEAAGKPPAKACRDLDGSGVADAQSTHSADQVARCGIDDAGQHAPPACVASHHSNASCRNTFAVGRAPQRCRHPSHACRASGYGHGNARSSPRSNEIQDPCSLTSRCRHSPSEHGARCTCTYPSLPPSRRCHRHHCPCARSQRSHQLRLCPTCSE